MINIELIKPSVRIKYLKNAKITVYTGFVTVYNGKKRLYSKFSGITRITPEDAMDDAEFLRDELLSI
jgi:hypothetical protein